ncbi:hypothetical protein M758_UG091000 [Ceratodon purpureus]|nr:hypothetical protein M758_UG091000 [Ceratodon purpureus]
MMPFYVAVSHLLDYDFEWNWSPACTSQYNALVELNGFQHMSASERPLRPLEPHGTTDHRCSLRSQVRWEGLPCGTEGVRIRLQRRVRRLSGFWQRDQYLWRRAVTYQHSDLHKLSEASALHNNATRSTLCL